MKVERSEREADAGLEAVVRLLLHETRTPLNAICGFTDLLLAGAAGPLSAVSLDYLTQVAEAGRVIERRLEDLEEIAAASAADAADGAVDLAAGLAEAGFPVAGVPCREVAGDPRAWRRLAELAATLLRSGEPDPVALEARFEAGGDGGLEVRLAPASSAPGGRPVTPLTLELARRLARQAGGVLRPCADPGTITVRFPPQRRDPGPDLAKPAPAGQMAAPAGIGGGQG